MPFIIIDESRCKGCGLCIIACPKKLIEMGRNNCNLENRIALPPDPEKCTGCAMCAEMCPDVAISVFME